MQEIQQQTAGMVLDKPKLMFLGAIVMSLFLTFYDDFDITQNRWFVGIAFVLFVASLFVMHEMPGFAVLMSVMLLFALRKEYMKNNDRDS